MYGNSMVKKIVRIYDMNQINDEFFCVIHQGPIKSFCFS